jgi:hypothetical protein
MGLGLEIKVTGYRVIGVRVAASRYLIFFYVAPTGFHNLRNYLSDAPYILFFLN